MISGRKDLGVPFIYLHGAHGLKIVLLFEIIIWYNSWFHILMF